jgi:hypothetical protein
MDQTGHDSVSPHDLRHICAVVRLNQLLSTGVEMASALEQMRAFFGWSRDSDMPLRYARAVFEDRLASVWNTKFDDHVEVLRSLPARLKERVGAKGLGRDTLDECTASTGARAVLRRFSDSYIQVTDANTSELWTISFDGRSATLDFGKFDVQIRGVVQSWSAEILASLSPRTAQYYYYGLRRILAGEIRAALTSVPQEIRPFWNKLHAGNLPYESFSALHNLITSCCNFHIASWGPRWLDLVSQLPFPRKDKYAAVRVGDVFLSIDEEAATVGYIDHVGTQIEAEPAALIDEVIVAAAILV